MKRELTQLRDDGRPGASITHVTAPPLSGVPYGSEAGFALFWDFLTSLPGSSARVVLAYALYDGMKPVAPVKVCRHPTNYLLMTI